MQTAVIYVLPNLLHQVYEPLAVRFANAYVQHPPGISEHALYVVVNGGGAITPRQEKLFSPLVPTFLHHDNSAKDLGAYMMAARTIESDFLVCLGSPVRPCRAGWLDCFVHACENNGPGIYGPWGFSEPTVHLRTTAFCITPELLNAYPFPVDNARRYQFEHSPQSITAFTMKSGFPTMQVTARGVFHKEHWHTVESDEALLLDQFHDAHNKHQR